MRVALGQWTEGAGWRFDASRDDLRNAQFVLYFGDRVALSGGAPVRTLGDLCPAAVIAGCSSGGEIFGADVFTGTIAAVAIRFARSHVELRAERGGLRGGPADVGRRLGEALPHAGLRGVFILSDGIGVNGSELVHGLAERLPPDVLITGGLAGDGAAFKTTLVGAQSEPAPGTVAAIGFYGDTLTMRSGSFGGWDEFGPQRVVTRSDGNVLYELDHQPALDLYKRYLGEAAARLPGSALLFPLRVDLAGRSGTEVVRTIVGIDEAAKAMIFAGDIPVGCTARLMRGDHEHLIAGAASAAEMACADGPASLAILVSCIGRKLLLGQRAAEEVEAAAEVLGRDCVVTGFYSYGEICPQDRDHPSTLHNQTMTVTVFGET